MERRQRSFLQRLFPRLWRRHRSEYTPARHHLRVNSPTSQSCNNIVFNRRPLFSDFGHSEQFGMVQPKCLPDVNYEDILNGSVENFSSNCWLENHLHRFGSVRRRHGNHHQWRQADHSSSRHRELWPLFNVDAQDFDSQGDEEEEEEDENDDQFSSSVLSSDEEWAEEAEVVVEPVPAFVQQVRESTHQAAMGFVPEEDPPPYFEDPPPSYEEATKGRNITDTSRLGYLNYEQSDILY